MEPTGKNTVLGTSGWSQGLGVTGGRPRAPPAQADVPAQRLS